MGLKRSQSIKGRQRRVQTEHAWNKLWHARGFVVLLLVAVFFLSVSVSKEIVRRVEITNEIADLESEVNRLVERNTDMSDLIKLFSTNSSQEKEARVKLGLQSPGENVIILPHRQQNSDIVLPDSDKIDYIPVNSYQSNPEKWLYFFWDKLDNLYTT